MSSEFMAPLPGAIEEAMHAGWDDIQTSDTQAHSTPQQYEKAVLRKLALHIADTRQLRAAGALTEAAFTEAEDIMGFCDAYATKYGVEFTNHANMVKASRIALLIGAGVSHGNHELFLKSLLHPRRKEGIPPVPTLPAGVPPVVEVTHASHSHYAWQPELKGWLNERRKLPGQCPAMKMIVEQGEQRTTLLHLFWDRIAELRYSNGEYIGGGRPR